MAESVETLMRSNLLEVFNERDESKRRAAIDRTYADDVRWTDSDGVTTGKEALEAKCVALQNALGAQQFVADGPVHELPGFGHLAWRLVDPADGEPRMTGFDVAIVADGLITDLFTVLIPPTS
ncbi:SnoaL-like domain-containing protein [Mycolicibacterium rutilum]|uniref:SnoaL-like domain-containing protein n=1 Tax=Mycolicibacterium rutilum TaxID=370526 RepID=A0A1H6K695_MYCRU|nr:nuclear transport factor 2 family protein [Mycolicibacterium rutilum]SEH70734.1 SnoaL-like domain-containing protein [Mycolicibacterium rutilum]